jgi:hypothetical protein
MFTCNVKQVFYVIKINFEVLLTSWCKALLENVLSLKFSEMSCFLYHPKAHFVFIRDKFEALFNVPFDVELLENHPIPKLNANLLSTV